MPTMNQQEALERIAEGESAYSLLRNADPNIERRWKRLCRSMVDLLGDVQQHFPDAKYYTASGGFNLMLGNSHADDRHQTSQQELIALSGEYGVAVGDGDF